MIPFSQYTPLVWRFSIRIFSVSCFHPHFSVLRSSAPCLKAQFRVLLILKAVTMKKPSNLLIFTVLCLDHPLEAFSSEQDNIVDNLRLRLARQTGETSSPRWGVSRSLHPPPPHPHKSKFARPYVWFLVY
jgi:hypothetical protein